MERGLPDEFTVRTAVAMAVRAPSVHNSQPWYWRVGQSSLHLYADQDRLLRETDPDGRDLILSCGAALHHIRVGFAALGWGAEVHRLPNPDEPDHLAAITLHQHDPSQDEVAMAAAIPRRRTDRRRHSSWSVPRGHVEAMARAASLEGTVLQVAEGSPRYHLATAIEEASRRHAGDPAYRTELAAWSGRHVAPDGVPSRNTPAPDDTPGALRTRAFADPLLAQPPDAKAEDDETVLLVLSTASDDRMSRLRAGEATSAVLLMANAFGLSSCPLTEPLELADVRESVTERVTGGSFPQMVLRVGWAPANADPLPATPRRDLADVLQPLEAPPKHFQAH
ncbi:NAD(P)H nitroreductase [Amycolatopsis sp. NBRC 101858]|uniref:Acg family FMN-binding oxidoreductase n=1 Tax=Amycolatopsis sp. NBRC 101858 TaxID=3032200 RepID=UPI0024A4A11E|nr:NAD(P)H nitroreductase [Amycolatopsis sp. NBRC 101858]GLY38157.1 NAD(P)H nitroreductase [Amycolatopsis sp. NBRC 101858]